MIICGDIHAGNKVPFSTTTKDGLNSRFVDTIKALWRVDDLIHKGLGSTLIFLGDVFDAPGETINKQVLLWVHNAFSNLANSAERIYILTGNHDIHRGHSMLGVLGDIESITVIDKPEWITIEGFDCLFIPFMRDPKDIISALAEMCGVPGDGKPSVLFGHFNVEGVIAGKALHRIDNHTIPLKKIPEGFEYVVLGHVHTPQHLGNILYLGSLLQANSGEEGDTKQVAVLDKNGLELIPFPGPQFHTVDIFKGDISALSDIRGAAPEDYYTLVLHDPIDESKLPRDHRVRVIRNYDMMVEERLDVKKADSKEELLKKYLENIETKLDKEKLVELALEVWEESR